VIEHCIAAFKKSQEEFLFRVYVTDALKLLTQCNARYYDIITPKEEENADDIIARIRKKLGGDA